jgi:hypothetical protein
VNSAESALYIFEKTFPEDKRPFAAIENAKENIRRTKSGEERLPRSSTAAIVLDAYAAARSAAVAGADSVAAAYAAANNVFTDAAFAAYGGGGDAAAAAYAAGYAAYAAGDISPHLFLNVTTAAHAVAAAGIAQKEGCDETRKNQKEIILKYFQ